MKSSYLFVYPFPLVLGCLFNTHATETDTSTTRVDNDEVEVVTVFGRGQNLTGIATSANEGEIGGADLINRPLLKVAELLEGMPGMVAVQHSGSGKANQYFLRGFNLDHGTDYSVSIDGTPMNLPSHGHGQGYLDVNGLITETVDSMRYRKGPYYASSGDFSLAGSAAISTIDYLNSPFVSVEAGSYGWKRLAGGASTDYAGGVVTAIAETKTYDGPWEKSEDLEHTAAWIKYAGLTSAGELEMSISAYRAGWDPTEQIPERVIGSDVCEDEYCMLDGTSSGETERWISSASLTGDNWSGTAFIQYYDWSMSSDPTYDYQINQFDRRIIVGSSAAYNAIENETLRVTTGISYRFDNIKSVGLEHYQSGSYVETLSSNQVNQLSAALYADAQWNIRDNLRLLAGLRQDFSRVDVSANTSGSASGETSDSLLQPKLGIAWAPFAQTELYANWGKGFHSNDARGATGSVPLLSPGYGKEIGARLNTGDLNVSITYWWLSQDSELIFVGDSNSVEPKGGSDRHGYEIAAFWQPDKTLAIDAAYTSSDATYKNAEDGHYIENAIEESAQLGISYLTGALEISARLRYLGPYALTTDNLHRSGSLTTVNFRTSYTLRDFTLYGEIINALDSDGKEISYYYPAFVNGFDAGVSSSDDISCTAINCTMSRATTPRSLRVGIRYNF